MLKRKIDSFLLDWKQKKEKKPLVVTGICQVGKTTSIEKLKDQYEVFIKIDFAINPKYIKIFEKKYNLTSILKNISSLNEKVKFIPNKTLLFFDNVELCLNALEAAKLFKENKDFDVIYSGFTLEMYDKIKEVEPFIEEYRLYPLDFEEYLWAEGYDADVIEDLYVSLTKMQQLKSEKSSRFSYLFRKYTCIGGLPKAVDESLKSDVLNKVLDAQAEVFNYTCERLGSHIDELGIPKYKCLYANVSTQLMRDNHKFTISKLYPKARFKDYNDIIAKLINSGMINRCYGLNAITLPFEGKEKLDNFHLYYTEHSMLLLKYNIKIIKKLTSDNNSVDYNCALQESLVDEALTRMNIDHYFYKNKDYSVEFDFVIADGNEIIPIEVKSYRDRGISLKSVLKGDYNVHYGIRLSENTLSYNKGIFTIPYYCLFLLKRFLYEKCYLNFNK